MEIHNCELGSGVSLGKVGSVYVIVSAYSKISLWICKIYFRSINGEGKRQNRGRLMSSWYFGYKHVVHCVVGSKGIFDKEPEVSL